MKATIYLSYRSIDQNLDSLLYDAYQMPSKHIIKASEIPEKVFISPEKKTYGTLFRIVGEAASQSQFFNRQYGSFSGRSLYFTPANYDSILPAARYVEQTWLSLWKACRGKNSLLCNRNSLTECSPTFFTTSMISVLLRISLLNFTCAFLLLSPFALEYLQFC